MKLGTYLLINVLVMGGGIFAYDSLKAGPVHPSSPGPDLLTADRPDEPEVRNEGPNVVMLDGGGVETMARRNAAEIAALKAEIKRLRSAAAPSDDGARPPLAANPPLPTLDPDDLLAEDDEDPAFDQRTLKTIEAYVDEINRRKSDERQRQRLEIDLQREGVTLSDSQKKAVLDTTLKFQERARELMRAGFPRDDKGREDRRAALAAIQEEYSTVINQLVPAADAEKITNSRFARGLGFFGSATNGVRGRPPLTPNGR